MYRRTTGFYNTHRRHSAIGNLSPVAFGAIQGADAA